MTGPSSSHFVEDSVNRDQPGDQACRVPTDSIHRQGCCRYACGDAVKVPQIQTASKTVESPPAQFADRVVDVPVIRQMDRVKSLPRRKDMTSNG